MSEPMSPAQSCSWASVAGRPLSSLAAQSAVAALALPPPRPAAAQHRPLVRTDARITCASHWLPAGWPYHRNILFFPKGQHSVHNVPLTICSVCCHKPAQERWCTRCARDQFASSTQTQTVHQAGQAMMTGRASSDGGCMLTMWHILFKLYSVMLPCAGPPPE